MTKINTTEKNFDLLVKFNKYLVKNPEIAEEIPKKACIIFELKGSPALNSANRKLARELASEGERCVKVLKSGSKWKIKSLEPA